MVHLVLFDKILCFNVYRIKEAKRHFGIHSVATGMRKHGTIARMVDIDSRVIWFNDAHVVAYSCRSSRCQLRYCD